jgi:hypothetical protein
MRANREPPTVSNTVHVIEYRIPVSDTMQVYTVFNTAHMCVIPLQGPDTAGCMHTLLLYDMRTTVGTEHSTPVLNTPRPYKIPRNVYNTLPLYYIPLTVSNTLHVLKISRPGHR